MAVIDVPTAEVSEAEASPPVKSVYDDIKQTLRVPIVNLIFRALATNLDVLQLSWRQLKPNVQTVFFEERADAIRARAVELLSGVAPSPAPPGDDAVNALRVFHYINPKLLVAVAGLRASANGQLPRVEELPAAAKRQIASGVPGGVVAPKMIDPASADEHVLALFGRVQALVGTTTVNSDYRALAVWPDYLDKAIDGWTDLSGRPDYLKHHSELRYMADEAVLMLPFRMELNPHVLRLCGCTEQQIDEVRSTLDAFYRLLPGLILNVAYLSSGALGREAAASPFPAPLASPI